MSNRELEKRLQELGDREAIKDLMARYCWTVDGGDWEEFLDLFADDVECDFGALGTFKGKEEWRKFVLETISSFFSKMRHLIHNEVIELEGDEGKGKAYFELVGVYQGESMVGGGHYEHKYIKINGQWKFRAVKAVIYYMAPIKEGWAKGDDYCGLKT